MLAAKRTRPRRLYASDPAPPSVRTGRVGGGHVTRVTLRPRYLNIYLCIYNILDFARSTDIAQQSSDTSCFEWLCLLVLIGIPLFDQVCSLVLSAVGTMVSEKASASLRFSAWAKGFSEACSHSQLRLHTSCLVDRICSYLIRRMLDGSELTCAPLRATALHLW